MAFIPTVLTQIIGALSLGSRVTLLRSREADKWLDQVGETAAELTYVPTPLIDEFAAAAESNQAAASSLRSVFHAGSQASRHDMTRLLEVFGSRVLEAWGMTETCGTPICATSPTDLAHIGVAALCETVGKAVNGASLSIVDPDAATGAGELVVEAPFLLDGYLESGSWKPSSTSGGGFNTGDVGRIDSDGYVRLVGRSKELIISGGVNVSPSEVEHCISQLQGVVEVGVFGLPHRRWGEAVAAAVVVEAGVRLEAEDVRNYVRTQLSRFKVPDSVFFVEQIPKTASMKVKRHELRHMFAE
jgi:acyl-CoA synthetase (AMP-forming)/AMP-acid ligase II